MKSWLKSEASKATDILRAILQLRALSSIIKNWIIVQCNSRDLIGLAAMVYEPLYHAQEKASIECLLFVLTKQNQQDIALVGCKISHLGYLSSHIQRVLVG